MEGGEKTSDAYRAAAEPDDLRKFRLDPEEHAVLARRALWRAASWGLPWAVFAAFRALTYACAKVPLLGIGITLLPSLSPAVVVLLLVVPRAKKATDAELATYELVVGRRVLRRVAAGILAAEILRPEVTSIVESRRGMWVACKRPKRSLFVSRALDGYDDVRATLSGWMPIQPIEGFASFLLDRQLRKRMGTRDAIAGTALANDPALRDELAAAREASRDKGIGNAKVRRPLRTLLLWVVLVVMFLAIWQFLSPQQARTHAMTADECRRSRACTYAGRCHEVHGACTATTEDDCAQSEACQRSGRCMLAGESCSIPPNPSAMPSAAP